jgi:hypothetical protein
MYLTPSRISLCGAALHREELLEDRTVPPGAPPFHSTVASLAAFVPASNDVSLSSLR